MEDASEQGRQPGSEEELRAQIEDQVRKLRVQDLLLEMAVSVLNLSARRIAKEDERDLEQARVGIDAVRAIVGLLDAEAAKQVQDALAQVQMLYARQTSGGGEEEGKAGGEEPGGEPGPERPSRPSGLWTPPGT